MDIGSVAISLFVAVVTSVITVHLTFRKYKSEKWWDRKTQCYLDTIEALNNIMQYCDAVLQGYQEDNDELEDLMRNLQRKFNQGRLELEKQINIGSLLLSDEAQKNLSDLESSLFSISSEKVLISRLGNIRLAVEECIDSFTINARKDLK